MIKFTLFSISAGIIQVASFTLMNEVLKMPYWPAYLISLILSIVWNFTFNRRYTFQSAANVPVAMASTGNYMPLIVLAVSGGAMAVFTYFSEKKKQIWLDNFSVAGSMLFGMTAAVIASLAL